MSTYKFIIVSNRLPVSVKKVDGKLEYHASSGGLATAMSSLEGEASDRLWIGWPGIAAEELTPAEKAAVTRKLRGYGCLPVFLTADQVDKFYGGYCNATLWPLFHYFQSTAAFHHDYWQAYKAVNTRIQKTVIRQASARAIIWVQDYQLMLLPGLLRAVLPKASIGFFLHTPFPSFEIFRLLPERKEILEGLLGADLIGFHTYDYVRHFTSSVSRTLGLESNAGTIALGSRSIRADALPIGIDYDKFQSSLRQPAVREELHLLQTHYRGQKVILSVDRLDYSKGLPERLAAYEQFLESYPQYHKQAVLVMVAVPSRTDVEAYQELRDEVEQTVSHINGRFGTVDWTPISYQFQNLPFEQLLALYAVADVALVTPLRDGMNLVAKEYVAAKQRTTGTLILSELAGAVDELPEALRINPYNTDSVARTIKRALSMPKAEQRRRLHSMQQRLSGYDVKRWAGDFIDELTQLTDTANGRDGKTLGTAEQQELATVFGHAKRRQLLLDYDGTLRGFVPSPDPRKAAPAKQLLTLLHSLARKPNTEVAVISGRPRQALERWFGKLPLDLVAEHGFWLKRGGEWAVQDVAFKHYKEQLLPVLRRYAERTPGATVEEKDFSLVWHYRNVTPELAYVRGVSLKQELRTMLADTDIAIYSGHKIIEIKPRGVNKGQAALELFAPTSRPDGTDAQPDFVLCAGDDQTDEDMFEALGEGVYSVKVGSGDTRAQYRLGTVQDMHRLLKRLSGSI